MPAIQNEYDDYSYIAMRRGTAKAAPRIGDVKKRVSATKTTARPKPTNVSTARMAAAKKANKESVRAVMRDNSRTVSKTTAHKKSNTVVSTTTKTRKKATHNLDVPNIKKKTAAKPQEISLKKAEMMKSPKQKAKEKTLKKENVVKNTATFLCLFSVLLLICYRSSVKNEKFQTLGELEAEVKSVEMMNLQLESDMQKINHEEMEIRAISQEMQKPKESQIQQIYITQKDRITTPISFEEEIEKNLWDKVWDCIFKWID